MPIDCTTTLAAYDPGHKTQRIHELPKDRRACARSSCFQVKPTQIFSQLSTKTSYGLPGAYTAPVRASLTRRLDSRARPERAAVSRTVVPRSAPLSKRPSGTAASNGRRAPSEGRAGWEGEETAPKTRSPTGRIRVPGFGFLALPPAENELAPRAGRTGEILGAGIGAGVEANIHRKK